MRNHVVGVLVGLMFGAGTASASYIGNDRFMEQSRGFQLGYVAGMSDTLETIADFAGYESAPSLAGLLAPALKSKKECIVEHSGSTLSNLTDWVKGNIAVTEERENVAHNILFLVCKP